MHAHLQKRKLASRELYVPHFDIIKQPRFWTVALDTTKFYTYKYIQYIHGGKC